MNTNEELIACIQAEMDGKRVEFRHLAGSSWHEHVIGGEWSTATYQYRIAKEPRVRWAVMDKDGDLRAETDDRAAAEADVAYLNGDGRFAPYTLCRIEEVL